MFLGLMGEEPDQMPHFVASDLVLHCLLMSHKKDARLIWVKEWKEFPIYIYSKYHYVLYGPYYIHTFFVNEN